MSTATIEVKFTDPPKNGKKLATVKTAAGEVFGVWPDKLALLRPGRKYAIEYSERPYNGRTYRTITKCEPQNGAARAPASAPPSGGPAADQREADFVARVLAASIEARAVEYTKEGLARAARMLRAVYRETMI